MMAIGVKKRFSWGRSLPPMCGSSPGFSRAYQRQPRGWATTSLSGLARFRVPGPNEVVQVCHQNPNRYVCHQTYLSLNTQSLSWSEREGGQRRGGTTPTMTTTRWEISARTFRPTCSARAYRFNAKNQKNILMQKNVERRLRDRPHRTAACERPPGAPEGHGVSD